MRARRAALLCMGCALAGAPVARAGDWHDLRAGSVVKVEGDWHVGRGLVADDIAVRADVTGSKVELIAPIQTLAPGGSHVTVLGARVVVLAGAAIRAADRTDIAFGALAEGDWVEIDGTVEGGVLRAHRIRKLAEVPDDIEIDGPVTSPTPAARVVEVAGVRVALKRDTTIAGGVTPLVVRAIDDDDARATLWTSADGKVRGGGRLQMKLEPEDNFDLNERRAGDLTRSKWDGDLQLDARAFPDVDAFVKAGFRGTRILNDEEGDEVHQFDWKLQQAYAVWQPHARSRFALQVGRQDFDEPREWLFDENLDGVRVHVRTGRVLTEASVSTRWNTQSSRLRDWTNWILYSRAEIGRRWEIGAYVLHRRGADTARDRPTWTGLRSMGRLTSSLRHWADLAILRGPLDGVKRDAWAVDVGLRYRLTRTMRPTITLGWAAGSGGPREEDRFLQTGLHDNNDKFGGVTSFRYYGELLEPDLSNLSIATAGAGFRPLRSTSIDVVVHHYEQRHAWPRVFGSNVDARPNGRETALGREWNVIVAFERISGADIEYVFAVFNPGAAFDNNATAARFDKLEFKINF